MDWLPAEAVIERAVAWPLASLALACVPFVAYALLSRNVAWDAKFVSALLLTTLLFAAHGLGVPVADVFLHSTLALAYFAAVSLGVHALRPWARRLPAPAVLTAVITAYVLLPALIVRNPSVVPALVVGWEAMFSAYSYCLDTKQSKVPPTVSEGLFFILVNPVLVYAERGTKLDPSDPNVFALDGGLRCLLGLCTWAAQAVAGIALAVWISASSTPNGTTGSGAYDNFVVQFWTNALLMYLAHSGLASVQIGLMRLAGWRIPERYHYPFLATSPADFWRRWNSYIGSWARRYLFLPWALRFGRSRWAGSGAEKAAAALATFFVIGALHGFVQYLAIRAGQPRAWGPLHVVGLFTAFGLAFVVWEGVARWKRVSRGIDRLRGWQPKRLAAWLLFSNVMCIAAWLALAPFG